MTSPSSCDAPRMASTLRAPPAIQLRNLLTLLNKLFFQLDISFFQLEISGKLFLHQYVKSTIPEVPCYMSWLVVATFTHEHHFLFHILFCAMILTHHFFDCE